MEQYRRTPRAKFIDYDGGDFFITICTHDKKHYFGEIINGEMLLSEVGNFARLQLERYTHYSNDVVIPIFVVMPNHIHAIVCINCRDVPLARIDENMLQRSPNAAFRANRTCRRHVPKLSRYVNSFKGIVTKYARENNIEFGWQSRYHDHLIRGNRDASNISDYIKNNVAKWQDDCFNCEE